MATDPYKPSQFHIDWLRDHLEMINNDGIWAIPASGDVCRVNRTEKKLIRIQGPKESYLWERTKQVAKEIGWETEDDILMGE